MDKHNDSAVAEIKHSERSDLSEVQEKKGIADAKGAIAQKLREAVGKIGKKLKKNKELVEMIAKNQLKDMEKLKVLLEIKQNLVEINNVVASTNIDGNLPLGPEGKPMIFSLNDETDISIPAQDFSVDIEKMTLDNNNPKNMRNIIRKAIEAINSYDGFMIGVHDRIEEVSTQMQFKIEDILKVEERINNFDEVLELSVFTISRIRQDAAKALRGQANIESEKAFALIFNA